MLNEDETVTKITNKKQCKIGYYMVSPSWLHEWYEVNRELVAKCDSRDSN